MSLVHCVHKCGPYPLPDRFTSQVFCYHYAHCSIWHMLLFHRYLDFDSNIEYNRLPYMSLFVVHNSLRFSSYSTQQRLNTSHCTDGHCTLKMSLFIESRICCFPHGSTLHRTERITNDCVRTASLWYSTVVK